MVVVLEVDGSDDHGIQTQAPVYDILPSTTAVFSYAIGPRKLSANKQFFVGAQTVVSLLQTTQIISDVCFITDHLATPAQIKPELFQTRRNSFFTQGGCVSCLCVCLGTKVASTVFETFQKALTMSVDSSTEIKSASLVA